MPISLSLDNWQTDRSQRLDEIEAAHQSIGGTGPGRRFATQQVNRAYAVLLAARFQGYCTDLYDECAAAIVDVTPIAIRALATINFSHRLAMARGNAGPENMGNDFQRLGVSLWQVLVAARRSNSDRKTKLSALNKWRNAIAHDDFDNVQIFPQRQDTPLRLGDVRASSNF